MEEFEQVYATDRSKAVALVLFLLCGLYYGAFHGEACLPLCSRDFSVLLAL